MPGPTPFAGGPSYALGMMAPLGAAPSMAATAGAASPYQIQGSLPFTPGGNPFTGALTGTAGIADQYGKSYKSALDLNQANYSNIMAGYSKVMGNQVGAENALQGGYTDLYNNVIGGIQGIGASQHQAIEDAYAQNAGQARQGLISRGLGNTTVMDSTNRGLMLDKQKANIALSNQIAQTTAGYQSQLGLSGLGYGSMATMANTGQGNRQLDFMNSVNSTYPNSGEYNSLFHAAGAKAQADADRQAMVKAAAGGRAGVAAPMGVGSSGGSFFSKANVGPLQSHAVMPDYGGGYGGGGGYMPPGGLPAGVVNQLPQPGWPTQEDFDAMNSQTFNIQGQPDYSRGGGDAYDLNTQGPAYGDPNDIDWSQIYGGGY